MTSLDPRLLGDDKYVLWCGDDMVRLWGVGGDRMDSGGDRLWLCRYWMTKHRFGDEG